MKEPSKDRKNSCPVSDRAFRAWLASLSGEFLGPVRNSTDGWHIVGYLVDVFLFFPAEKLTGSVGRALATVSFDQKFKNVCYLRGHSQTKLVFSTKLNM